METLCSIPATSTSPGKKEIKICFARKDLYLLVRKRNCKSFLANYAGLVHFYSAFESMVIRSIVLYAFSNYLQVAEC